MTRKLLLSVVNNGIDSFGCEYTKINMHDVNFDHFDVQYKNGTVRKNLFPIVLYLFSIVICFVSFLPSSRADHLFLSVINISLSLNPSPSFRQYFVIVTSIYFQDSVFLVLLSEY